MVKIAATGTGYVGLVSGACLADFGNTVVCVDTDGKKIQKLRDGGIPIFEPGLDELLKRTVEAKRLSFTTDASSAIAASEVVFIAVGTPPADDGSADPSRLLKNSMLFNNLLSNCSREYPRGKPHGFLRNCRH